MPTIREHFDALWTGAPEGFVLARALDDATGAPLSEDRFFAWPSEAEALVEAAELHEDGVLYVGAALRSEPLAERSKASSVAALWTTVNLSDVPIERAVEAVRAFPLKPSAGLVVRDALHVLWLLKEPLSGAGLDEAWAANRAAIRKIRVGGLNGHHDTTLLRAGLQANHYDFDGLLRAPGQPGARFVAWRPDARYGVAEFMEAVEPPRPPAPPAAAPEAPAPKPPARRVSLDSETRTEVADLLAGIWLDGTHMASQVAGMLAKAGIASEDAREIVAAAAAKAGADGERAGQDAERTYQRHDEGKDVSGGHALGELVASKGPVNSRDKAKRVVERLRKRFPPLGAENGLGPEADFKIVKLVKFDSRPARWRVGLKLADGTDLDVIVETQAFHLFSAFKSAVQEQTHYALSIIREARWWHMIGEARATIEVQETPKEARPEGAIESALEEFLSDAKERPDVGLLRSFAGYDEESRFFKYTTFKDFLKENGMRLEDRVVYEHLKRLGYKNTVKRFGPRLLRVWMQTFQAGTGGNGQNGSGGDGPGLPEGQPPSGKSPVAEIPDLFDLPELQGTPETAQEVADE